MEKFQTVIKQNEALITARDFKGGEGGALRRVTEDLSKQEGRLHFLCNKVHKKRECKQQCGGCKMFGSHLEKDCWTLYPDKRPTKFETPKKKRGREREISKSKDKEETRPQNKGRGNSPAPPRVVGRVNKRQLTDRDSDDSVEKEGDPKEIERNYLEAKELYEKQIRRARRVRRDHTERSFNTERIFADEAGETQYTNMKREFSRGPSRRMRRVKRCSPL